MSAALDTAALFEAMQQFVKQGHSFTLAPAGELDGESRTHASISGPSGSRSSIKSSPAEALEDLIVQVVEGRLT